MQTKLNIFLNKIILYKLLRINLINNLSILHLHSNSSKYKKK